MSSDIGSARSREATLDRPEPSVIIANADRSRRKATSVAARLRPAVYRLADRATGVGYLWSRWLIGRASATSTRRTHRGTTPWQKTRKGEVTFKGNPVELVGPKLKAGRQGPRLHLRRRGPGGRQAGRHRGQGPAVQRRAVARHPGLQHADQAVRRGAQQPWATRSRPTPSASTCRSPRRRFCTEAKIENMKNLSDVHDHSFGEHYGVLIQGLPIPLLARAVFVVDPSNTITLRRDRPRDRPGAQLRAGPGGARRRPPGADRSGAASRARQPGIGDPAPDGRGLVRARGSRCGEVSSPSAVIR